MNETPLLLCIETATPVCSAALFIGAECISLREHSEGMAHAEKLTVLIREILEETGLAISDLSAVAVSGGPGSYTGLRIGVSTAKGLCFAADRPLIAIPTLQSMAAGVISGLRANGQSEDILLCPMLDARRMEVYTAIFDVSGREVEPVSAKVVQEGVFDDRLHVGQVLFFGDGMPKCKSLLSAHANARFVDDYRISAADMIQPALQAYAAADFRENGLYEPFYFKEFVAGKGSVSPIAG
jgi:tRNA threonylcarbamoyladenosine biosynthesis protein TsaB